MMFADSLEKKSLLMHDLAMLALNEFINFWVCRHFGKGQQTPSCMRKDELEIFSLFDNR